MILAGVRAAALAPSKRADDRRLGAVEQVADLTRLEQVGVEDGPLVVDRDPRVAGPELGDAGSGGTVGGTGPASDERPLAGLGSGATIAWAGSPLACAWASPGASSAGISIGGSIPLNGFDGWVSSQVTIGFTTVYRLIALHMPPDGITPASWRVGHALQGALQLGLHW